MIADGYERNESITKFRVRVYCNTNCLNTDEELDAAKRFKGQAKREEQKKTCEVCEKEYTRGRTETSSTFEARHTCGNVCAGLRRKAKTEEKNKQAGKTCANPECGKTFYRRTTGETWTKFQKRETCSKECGHAKRRGGKPAKPRKVSNKGKVPSTLPPVTPLQREIPSPPRPTVIKVWRPESWGGSYTRQVS